MSQSHKGSIADSKFTCTCLYVRSAIFCHFYWLLVLYGIAYQ